MTWLRTLMADEAGNPSSMRAMAFLVVAVTMLTWSIHILTVKSWVSPDEGMAMLIAAAMGAKAWQKGKEK